MQVKDIDLKQGIFTGYFGVFNTPDNGKVPDIIEPGAFTKTFKEWGPGGKNRIKCVYQHDPTLLVGRPLKLEEHDYGAYHETKVSTRTTLGHDVLVLIDDGVLTEMSFGYDALKAQMDQQAGARHLKELKLWEYCPVTWGLHPDTMITGVKAAKNPDFAGKQMQRMEAILRKGALQDDEVISALERLLPEWRKAVAYLVPKDPEREQIQIETKEAGGEEPPAEQQTMPAPAGQFPEGARVTTKGGMPQMEGKADQVQTPKARDFNAIVTQELVEEKLRQQWWTFNDALRTAIREIIKDTTITDKVTAVTATVDQYKTAIVAWVTQAMTAGLWADQQKADQTAASMEMKAGGPEATKAGRAISQTNRNLISDAMTALTGAVDSLQALLTATEPAAAAATQDPKEPPKDDGEPAAKGATPEDEQILNQMLGQLKGLGQFVKGA